MVGWVICVVCVVSAGVAPASGIHSKTPILPAFFMAFCAQTAILSGVRLSLRFTLPVVQRVVGVALNSLRLADIQPGQTVVVTHVCCGFSIAARLMELGFVPGAAVQVLRRAPFGGPVQYRVQGVSLTMRPDDARCVYVGGAGECDGQCGCSGVQSAEAGELLTV
ncbi:MAG: ferrous iron transport protein A [Planctomycetaceae bacterium]